MTHLRPCSAALLAVMASSLPALAQDSGEALVTVLIEETGNTIQIPASEASQLCDLNGGAAGQGAGADIAPACTISQDAAVQAGYGDDQSSLGSTDGDDDDDDDDNGHGNDDDGVDDDNPGNSNGVAGGNGGDNNGGNDNGGDNNGNGNGNGNGGNGGGGNGGNGGGGND